MSSRGLVVLPTYNEAENLPTIVEQILSYGPDILVVDDASPDGTGDLAEQLKQRLYPRLDVLHRPRKAGLGTAYIAGFKRALEQDYELILEMDCDFSHDPRHLPTFLERIETADLVLGSRYIRGGGTVNWSQQRKLISKVGSLYSRLILGLPYRDLTGGFKCFRRSVLESLDLDSVESNGYAFQIELTYRAHRKGFRIVEVPIIFQERREGLSKMSRAIVLEAMVKVWHFRFAHS